MSAQRPIVLLGHKHVCPIHGLGVVVTGSPTCTVHGKPVVRVGDKISCGATIVSGSQRVKIDSGQPVARMGDKTDHGGELVEGETGWNLE